MSLVLYVHGTSTDVHCMLESKNLCVYAPFISGYQRKLPGDSPIGSVSILGVWFHLNCLRIYTLNVTHLNSFMLKPHSKMEPVKSTRKEQDMALPVTHY